MTMTFSPEYSHQDRSVIDNGTDTHRPDDDKTLAIVWGVTSHISSHTASNAFGAYVSVDRFDDVTYALLFDVADKWQGEPWNNVHNIELSFHVPVNEAQMLDKQLRILIICHLKDNTVIPGHQSLPATMSEPTEVSTKYKYLHVSLEEVRVFNPETGKVYYQSTAPFSDLPLNHNMNRILSTNIRLCFS
jgi:hypothetical protein